MQQGFDPKTELIYVGTALVLALIVFASTTRQMESITCPECNTAILCPSAGDDGITVTYPGQRAIFPSSLGRTTPVNKDRNMSAVAASPSDTPGQRFIIHPDTSRTGGPYPQLVDLEPGYLVYVPGLRHQNGFMVEFCDTAPEGWAMHAPNNDLDGFVFIGPQTALRSHEQFRYAASASINAEQRNWVRETTALILNGFAADFDVEPSSELHLFFATLPDDIGGFYDGQLTQNGVILVSAKPDFVNEGSDLFRQYFLSLLAHEGAHFWNHNETTGQRWLWEGSADYFAYLLVDAHWPEQSYLYDDLTQQMNSCLNRAPDLAITRYYEDRYEFLNYDCGVIVQLIADLAIRKSSNGNETIFDLWHTLLSQNDDLAYARANFFRRLDYYDRTTSRELQNIWLRNEDPEVRMRRTIAMLNSLGANIMPGQTDQERSSWLVLDTLNMPLQEYCRDSFEGLRSVDDGVIAHLSTDCPGGIIVDFKITRINGFEIPHDANAAYNDARASCAARRNLRLSGVDPDGNPHMAELPCRRDLPPPSQIYSIQSLGAHF